MSKTSTTKTIPTPPIDLANARLAPPGRVHLERLLLILIDLLIILIYRQPHLHIQSSAHGHMTRRPPSTSSSASSGTQGTFPREGGDEEPLFGGRPFRESHQPSSSSPSGGDKEYLYAILNVPTDATPDAIKDAYRSLAVVLHPDKHSDASVKRGRIAVSRGATCIRDIVGSGEEDGVRPLWGRRAEVDLGASR